MPEPSRQAPGTRACVRHRRRRVGRRRRAQSALCSQQPPRSTCEPSPRQSGEVHPTSTVWPQLNPEPRPERFRRLRSERWLAMAVCGVRRQRDHREFRQERYRRKRAPTAWPAAPCHRKAQGQPSLGQPWRHQAQEQTGWLPRSSLLHLDPSVTEVHLATYRHQGPSPGVNTHGLTPRTNHRHAVR